MERIREQDLPFKVKRHDVPKMVYGAKWKASFAGEHQPRGEWIPRKKAIYFYGSKNPTKATVEHEIAHYQLAHAEKVKEYSLDEIAEQEVQADLLAYARSGTFAYQKGKLDPMIEAQTSGLSADAKGFMQNASVIQGTMRERLSSWEVPIHTKIKRELDVLNKVMRKYWKWLPSEWKEGWQEYYRLGMEVARARGLPPHWKPVGKARKVSRRRTRSSPSATVSVGR